MYTIAFEDGGEQEPTVSAFLMLVLEYATEIGLFSLLERLLHVTMKTVVYSPLYKAQTVIASLVANLLVLFGAGWLGGITGAVGAAFHNRAIENVGTISSLIIPTDGLWRGAIYNLQPVALVIVQAAGGRAASGNPSLVSGPPTTAYVIWSAIWVVGVLALAAWSFHRREL